MGKVTAQMTIGTSSKVNEDFLWLNLSHTTFHSRQNHYNIHSQTHLTLHNSATYLQCSYCLQKYKRSGGIVCMYKKYPRPFDKGSWLGCFEHFTTEKKKGKKKSRNRCGGNGSMKPNVEKLNVNSHQNSPLVKIHLSTSIFNILSMQKMRLFSGGVFRFSKSSLSINLVHTSIQRQIRAHTYHLTQYHSL